MLGVKALEAGYGKKQVLYGVSIDVHQGEIVALVGPNGAGKSTLLKSICGLTRVWKGKILFNGVPIHGATPTQNVARGITFAPQGSRVFHHLTVRENLEVGGVQFPRKRAAERVAQMLETFPALKTRMKQRAGTLAGGEQQMLAFARALLPDSRLLMLDEPTLGLSPNLVSAVLEKIVEVTRERCLGVLIVEQKVREVLEISNRVYSLKLGKVAFEGSPEALKHDKTKLTQLFL